MVGGWCLATDSAVPELRTLDFQMFLLIMHLGHFLDQL